MQEPNHPLRIALVGDRSEAVAAHRAIPLALQRSAAALGEAVAPVWIGTEAVETCMLGAFDALWCVPGSPYACMDGVLAAIRHARSAPLPFLGTCAGFQHVLIEHARHVLGIADADHEETAPGAGTLVVTRLRCTLWEARGTVRVLPGTRLHAAVGREALDASYTCNFGPNPALRARLEQGGLRVSALDEAGEVRAVERAEHPFFVATLFQPELAALEGRPLPLVEAFVGAAARARRAGALAR
ncbi:MAG: hypothetical protein EYC70_12955 [Planctomycetota bacterium]|nr:MAG: hypothetical protein EYC70_12955 [Planctomycetota bacterium]